LVYLKAIFVGSSLSLGYFDIGCSYFKIPYVGHKLWNTR